MSVKKATRTFILVLLICCSSYPVFSQAKKPAATAATPAKGGAAPAKGATVAKGAAKGTLAADMDCTIKINGVARPAVLKAYTPTDVPLKTGDNLIEAVSSDKKSTYKRNVTAKAGEIVLVEISFFEDGKFLDYVKNGNVNMVEAALKKDPSLLNNDNGLLTSSPLEIAIVNSQPDLVKYFMSKGASFSKPENIFPLHKTVLYVTNKKPAKDKPAPDRELVDYFLTKGCKLTDKDDGGNTPLLCAVRANKLDLVMYFVDKGADINAKNDFDDTPLKMAQDKGEITILNYLKSKGALEK